MKSVGKAVSILLVVVGLAGLAACAVNPVTGQQDFVLMSEDQEIGLGRTYNAEILKEMKRYPDEALQAYVQAIGERLARESHRSNLVYRFSVMDSADVNAFALPGGYIYITRGLLAHLNSEAELAAVLGHEIGHVTARHAVRQHSAATATGILGAVIASQAGFEGARDITDVVGTAMVRGYGREHELEADRLGAEYLARSGYDPQAMLRVIGVLKAQEQFEQQLAKEEDRSPRTYHGVFSTHPDNDERLQTVVRAAERFKQNGWHDERNGFLQRLDGLVFGDSDDQGVLRGERFFHAALGIGMSFPRGWSVENRPDHLLAYNAGRDAWLQVAVEEINRRLTPREFLEKRLGLSGLQHGEEISHQGMRGYTAIVALKTPFGQRDARVTLLYQGDRAYVFAGAVKDRAKPYQYDEVFLAAARSLHVLDAEEQRLAKATRLEVGPAAAATDYAELARQSPLANHAEAQLRLLNAAYPSGEPVAGQLIKWVE